MACVFPLLLRIQHPVNHDLETTELWSASSFSFPCLPGAKSRIFLLPGPSLGPCTVIEAAFCDHHYLFNTVFLILGSFSHWSWNLYAHQETKKAKAGFPPSGTLGTR